MTLSVSAVASRGPWPQVTVTVSSSPAVTDEVKVWRVRADGSRLPVLSSSRPVIIGGYTVIDYHPPFGETFSYAASTSAEAEAVSGPVVFVSKRLWVIHPTDPNLSVSIGKWRIDPFKFSYPTRAQGFPRLQDGLQSFRPRQGGRGGQRGVVGLKCPTRQDREKLFRLLKPDTAVLFNSPFPEEIGSRWIKPLDVDFTNPATFTQHPDRWVEFPYEECAQPKGRVAPRWTYDQAAEVFATYDQAAAVYDDYRAAQLDIRT